MNTPASGGAHFSADERTRLLALPRIGPQVVDRLEAAGFHSLDAMRRAGLDAVIGAVCQQQGQAAWRNRRRALAPALD